MNFLCLTKNQLEITNKILKFSKFGNFCFIIWQIFSKTLILNPRFTLVTASSILLCRSNFFSKKNRKLFKKFSKISFQKSQKSFLRFTETRIYHLTKRLSSNSTAGKMSDETAAAGSAPAANGKAPNKRMSVERIYQKKSQLEHILLRPDTYIGSVQPVTEKMWVLDAATESIVAKEISYVPGLYKIFDEVSFL